MRSFAANGGAWQTRKHHADIGSMTEMPVEQSSGSEIEAVLNRLTLSKVMWVRVGILDRLDYLQSCGTRLLDVSSEWVNLSCAAKGIDPGSALAGEEWISGPMVILRSIRLLRGALQSNGHPVPRRIRQRTDGQFVADVMPTNLFDRLLFSGVRAEVWIEPGKPPSQGRIYCDKTTGQHASGRVSLVLGAGNIASIAPTDVLHKLFVEDEVVVLKMNPVNEYLGPLIERAFGPLVDDGYLAVLYGGSEIGSRLCHDSRVETIHLTGSDRTHDAIVWGADTAEQTRRKADRDPLLNKPVSSELGCVTPVLVVPGP